MIKGVLICLEGHGPSVTTAKMFSDMVIGITAYIDISVLMIRSNAQLKLLKKKYKFKDLPAIKMEGDGTVYYKDEVKDVIKGIVKDARKKQGRRGKNYALKIHGNENLHNLRTRISKQKHDSSPGKGSKTGDNAKTMPYVPSKRTKDS